jgi:hypothetical protein
MRTATQIISQENSLQAAIAAKNISAAILNTPLAGIDSISEKNCSIHNTDFAQAKRAAKSLYRAHTPKTYEWS